MVDKVNSASLEELKKWWHQQPETLTIKFTRAMVLDEIAWAIVSKDVNGRDFLMECVYDKDIEKRNAAIYMLATKEEINPTLNKVLLDAFESEDERVQMNALMSILRNRNYLLSKAELEPLKMAKDPKMEAWVMTYCCYAFPKERADLLKNAVTSKNARMREFACDVIGDEFLYDLKELMKPLLADTNKRVAQSAQYNYYEMLS